ncbi:Na+/H+ antiporter [Actinocorallia sp. A-T 12471]|uniref:Na+/H+ antiporter n=1 Tax=Actinocorallia sp. A-T 12471 TaxID=3089813 RepID=UPI0029CDE575|nr:Na+/H+ antiporter [Actinocorallia sp. A-T 12471]MDX6740780.1 Na+/H+ antiporter [Actinocorallia sp. A-T 12471]
MLGLELVVALGFAVLVCSAAADRLGVAPPIVLLLGGIALGFVPALRDVRLPPEAVLLLFLPALLYWESLTTSPREIRRYLRGIVLMSTVLVIVTAGAVAVVAHGFGLPWGPAWVLGAAVAPTDATAVGALARILPRRYMTALRAESLINDGTALVVYGLAVGITVGEESLSTAHVSWLFLVSYVGGVLVGIVTAKVGVQVRARIADAILGSVAMLLVPFTAFLAAELVGASGVLAVVVCGLIMSQAGPHVGRAATRLQTVAFYSLAAFVLNAALFVLIGVEAQTVVRALDAADLARGLVLIGVVCAVLVAVRVVFIFAVSYLIRLLDRRPQQHELRISDRARIVSGVAGFRGAVSLAAAMAIPMMVASGAPFPGRSLIVFVTFGVIVVTVLVQGLLLPAVVRWARFPEDLAVGEERRLAETLSVSEALDALPHLVADLRTSPEVAERLRLEYETHLAVLNADGEEADTALRRKRDDTALRLALVSCKRATVLRLRDERRIDDTVLRQIQSLLDIEELRLTPHPLSD